MPAREMRACSQIAERSLFYGKNSASKRNKSLFFNCRKQYVLYKNYGSRSKKGEFLRFELSHNALKRKPQK